MKTSNETQVVPSQSSSLSLKCCSYIKLSAVLNEAEVRVFNDCDWKRFTFGDCDKSFLSRDRMIEELTDSGEDFHSAIKTLMTLPSEYFVEL
jgi:hypothetical protein